MFQNKYQYKSPIHGNLPVKHVKVLEEKNLLYLFLIDLVITGKCHTSHCVNGAEKEWFEKEFFS
jgi:hypothetical protein